MVGFIKDEVEAQLRIKCSPHQISKSLVPRDFNVSHEAIYQHIANDRKAGGDLSLNLRINGRRRYRGRSKIGRGEKIPNQVDIGKADGRFPRSSCLPLMAAMNISKKSLFFVTSRVLRTK